MVSAQVNAATITIKTVTMAVHHASMWKRNDFHVGSYLLWVGLSPLLLEPLRFILALRLGCREGGCVLTETDFS